MVISNALACSLIVAVICLIGGIVTFPQRKKIKNWRIAFSVFFFGFLIFGVTPIVSWLITYPF